MLSVCKLLQAILKRWRACDSTICYHANLGSSKHPVVHPVTRLQQCTCACQYQQQQHVRLMRTAVIARLHHLKGRIRIGQRVSWGLRKTQTLTSGTAVSLPDPLLESLRVSMFIVMLLHRVFNFDRVTGNVNPSA